MKLKVLIIIFSLLLFSNIVNAETKVMQLGINEYKPEHNAYVHNNRGLLYVEVEQYHAAIQEFKIAIALNPNTQATSVYYGNLGDLYMKLGNYTNAQDCFEHAIYYNPHNFKYYLDLVTSYQYQGKLKSELSKLKKHKQTPLDDIKIGLIYIAMGQKNTGINILDEFIMNEPKLYITDGVKYYLQQYDKLHQK